MLKILTSFYFCANKNYTSSFKIRARLSEFFKHVHPDQLAQAPVYTHIIEGKSQRVEPKIFN